MATDADVEEIIATVRRRAPVAFVFAQPWRAGSGAHDAPRVTDSDVLPGRGLQAYLLAPPEILARRDIRFWRLQRTDVRAIPGRFFTVLDVGEVAPVP